MNSLDLPDGNPKMLQYSQEEALSWIRELTAYMQREAERFTKVNLAHFELIVVRMYDTGTFIALPSSNVLPHAYPENREEVGRLDTHFTYPVDWKAAKCHIRKFDEMYHGLPDADHDAVEFERLYAEFNTLKVEAIRAACAGLDPSMQVLAFVHDTPLWIPMAIHVHGPSIPILPPPKSDVALFCRLRHCSYNYVSESAFEWSGDHISKVSISGGNLKDQDMEFVWQVPNLKALCPALREIVIEHSSLSRQTVERLKKLLPGVTMRHSEKG